MERIAESARSPETHVYSPELEEKAARVLQGAEKRGLRIVTAESCTGGALAALLTDVEGLAHVFERGFAVYCSEAKAECLGVPADMIVREGAISAAVARAMAQGALAHSHADVAAAITGNAGPAGADEEEGLVYICAALRGGDCHVAEYHFGAAGRARVRMKALASALDHIERVVAAA